MWKDLTAEEFLTCMAKDKAYIYIFDKETQDVFRSDCINYNQIIQFMENTGNRYLITRKENGNE